MPRNQESIAPFATKFFLLESHSELQTPGHCPMKGKKARVRAPPPPQETNLLSRSPRLSLHKDEGLSDPCSFLVTSGHPVAAREITLLLVPLLPTEWAKTGEPIRVVGDRQAGSTDFLQLQREDYCPVWSWWREVSPPATP